MQNYFNRLYHILPDYFKPYNDLTSFTQYMLRFACILETEIPSETFIYISESNARIDDFVLLDILNIDRLFHS
jgi:hypothetical protein